MAGFGAFCLPPPRHSRVGQMLEGFVALCRDIEHGAAISSLFGGKWWVPVDKPFGVVKQSKPHNSFECAQI